MLPQRIKGRFCCPRIRLFVNCFAPVNLNPIYSLVLKAVELSLIDCSW